MKRRYRLNAGPISVFGEVVACPKCGRKILVEANAVMPRGECGLTAVCLECVELADAFREESPLAAALIDECKAELEAKREG
jgi:hypothetical protein